MKTLQLSLGEKSYPIYIGSGLLHQPQLWQHHIRSKHVLIVSNTTVAALYLNPVMEALKGFQLATIALPDGEEYKRLDTLNTIFDCLLSNKYGRDASLIALGGGVVGDLGGFAAACYQRGIALLQMPTTVLAQVDSSVGGKTGVNHPLGKNMIGAFYQPQCVIADLAVLDTLEQRQLLAGLAEVIKYGLLRDHELFVWLEQNIALLLARDKSALAYVIERSCLNKAAIVAADEFEAGIRATLNLGHTFAHAIETGTNYNTYLHGEAVAIGLCYAADLSHRMGLLVAADVDRIIALVKRAKLPVSPPTTMTVARFIELMSVDKKNVDGGIRFILLEAIGKATLPLKVEQTVLEQTLTTYGK